MRAMSHGIGVYVEKPLAHTFEECELMMKAELKYKVAAQMGNQGHSGANYFQFKAWKEAGIIKDITAVTAYMNKGRRWHPWTINNGFPTGEEILDHQQRLSKRRRDSGRSRLGCLARHRAGDPVQQQAAPRQLARLVPVR